MTSETRSAAWTAFLATVRVAYAPAGYARSGSRFLRVSGDVVVSARYQRDARRAGRDIVFCVDLEVYLLRLPELVTPGSAPRAVVAGENPHWWQRLTDGASQGEDQWWSLDTESPVVAGELGRRHLAAARDEVVPRLAAMASEEAVLAAWRAGDLRVSAERAAERISRLETVIGGTRGSRELVPWADLGVSPGVARAPAP